MRFITTDAAETTPSILDRALKETDSSYSIAESGELKYGDDLYGALEVNRPGDELFEEELEELKSFVEDVRGKRKADVLKTLEEARVIVAVQFLFGDREHEVTLRKLDPLWMWLFSHRRGLLQVDGEGYYDNTTLILKVD